MHTYTAVHEEGRFTLRNVPVVDDLPVVIQVGKWRRQLVAQAAEAFSDGEPRETPIDVKALHAKIGQQALELDFLANALGRGPGPSGKR